MIIKQDAKKMLLHQIDNLYGGGNRQRIKWFKSGL